MVNIRDGEFKINNLKFVKISMKQKLQILFTRVKIL